MIDKSLTVLALSRDCGRYLPAVFKNLERLRPFFKDFSALIIENDSLDDTVSQIRNYGRLVPGIQARSLIGIDQHVPVRTERLAHLRNALLEWMRSLNSLDSDGLVLVMDCDEVNTDIWDIPTWIDVLRLFLSCPSAAGVFANQEGSYYDLWPLRHTERCPGDVWQEVLELHFSNPTLSDQDLITQAYIPRMFSIPINSSIEKVDSAFGGLCFYKASWLLRNNASYSGIVSRWVSDQTKAPKLLRWQVSEHVSFNLGFKAMGADLWIHPALVNWKTVNLPNLRPNPRAWRHMNLNP
mgnify:CR=1 FL=1